ncbi:unnamed protein product [Aureobasidium pullulans]|nr:unnamed protein product [Aureobasidium pullulans]
MPPPNSNPTLATKPPPQPAAPVATGPIVQKWQDSQQDDFDVVNEYHKFQEEQKAQHATSTRTLRIRQTPAAPQPLSAPPPPAVAPVAYPPPVAFNHYPPPTFDQYPPADFNQYPPHLHLHSSLMSLLSLTYQPAPSPVPTPPAPSQPSGTISREPVRYEKPAQTEDDIDTAPESINMEVSQEPERKREGGGWAQPAAMGRISKAFSLVAKFEGMLRDMDIDQAIEEDNLMQRIGEKLEDYGRSERVFIDRATGRVFVKFTSALSAFNAIKASDGTDFLGNGQGIYE